MFCSWFRLGVWGGCALPVGLFPLSLLSMRLAGLVSVDGLTGGRPAGGASRLSGGRGGGRAAEGQERDRRGAGEGQERDRRGGTFSVLG